MITGIHLLGFVFQTSAFEDGMSSSSCLIPVNNYTLVLCTTLLSIAII